MIETVAEPKEDCRYFIDQKLDSVDRVLLQAGVPRTERTAILAELDGQILDSLAAEVGDRDAQATDVIKVIAKLGPPESYAPEAYRAKALAAVQSRVSERRIRRPRVSALAISSMCVAAFNVPMLMATCFMIANMLEDLSGEVLLFSALCFIPTFMLAIVSAGLGIAAIARIRQSGGWLYGIGCAIPGAGLVPLLFLQVVFCGILYIGTMGVGVFILPVIYVGATTAFMCHGIWHWLTAGYIVREPELIEPGTA